MPCHLQPLAAAVVRKVINMLKQLILKSVSIAHKYFSLDQLNTHQDPYYYLESSIPQTTTSLFAGEEHFL